MSNEYRPSPSPSKVGFSLLSRRQFIIGASGVVGAGALLAACGSDSSSSDTVGVTDTAAAPVSASGDLTFGSNYSDEKPKAAIAAAIAAFGNSAVTVNVNTVDHNSYQENITNYLQNPDDVMCWFAGYRMRFFAEKGLVGNISDVWTNLTELSDGFKSASTGNDGNQYFVPFYYYPWGIHYRKSLFAEKGYTVPTTLAEFKTLAAKMQADGITPLAAANDGKWPQMGMFDMINMRTNGYDFHVSLMAGNEDWTSPEVKQVFATWAEILPLQQTGANGRTWQDGANALGDKSAGMYLLGTFMTSNFTDQAIIDDIDFFGFPEINPEFGQDAVEAPIDGFMMAASPKNEAAAKELLGFLGTAVAEEAYLAIDPSSVGASSAASTANYNAIQKKSAEFVGAAKYISQFLDRDTNPEFASNVMGDALAQFIENPGDIDKILANVEEQKKVIFAA